MLLTCALTEILMIGKNISKDFICSSSLFTEKEMLQQKVLLEKDKKDINMLNQALKIEQGMLFCVRNTYTIIIH